jgi:hypothetical protein
MRFFIDATFCCRYGPADFSVKSMFAWDSGYLYLALDITDDKLMVDEVCFKQGIQIAFEVGGAKSIDADGQSLKGVLQAKRSTDTAISRLDLINLGLKHGQTHCLTKAGNTKSKGPAACCVNYEHNSGDGWAYQLQVGVSRDEAKKHTTYEVAVSKLDLLGNSYAKLERWHAGIHFGFAFAANDGDSTSDQNGWAGYYPYAIVHGWHGGEKSPSKAGVLVLDGPARSANQWTRIGGADDRYSV